MRENGRRENRVVQHAECGLGARLGAEEPLLARFGRLLEPMAAARHVWFKLVVGERDLHTLESVAVTDAVALAAEVSMLILQQ